MMRQAGRAAQGLLPEDVGMQRTGGSGLDGNA